MPELEDLQNSVNARITHKTQPGSVSAVDVGGAINDTAQFARDAVEQLGEEVSIKADSADLDSLETVVSGKAPVASPTFTGDAKAVTPAAGDNDTSVATTAFVATATAAKANIAAPTFTGDAKAVTPAAGDNDSSIATTAFVQATVATAKRPYKVCTVVISQNGTDAPEVLYTLENNLGGDVIFTREGVGSYKATLPVAAGYQKAALICLGYSSASHRISSVSNSGTNLYFSSTNTSNNGADGLISYDTVEIRVYE